MMPNSPQNVIGVFALLRLAATLVNINPAYTPPEVEHLVSESGIRIFIKLDPLAGVATQLRSVANLDWRVVAERLLRRK